MRDIPSRNVFKFSLQNTIMRRIKALKKLSNIDSYKAYCNAKSEAIAKHLSVELTAPIGKSGFKVPIYKYKRMTQKMVDELVSYDTNYCESRRLKTSSRANYISVISLTGRWLHEAKGFTSFEQAGEKELREYLTQMQKVCGESHVLTWRISIKTFYRHLLTGKNQKKDPFPSVVSWITLSLPKDGPSLTEKRIPDEEFIALDKACTDPRMKCLLHLLNETGSRVGTALSLRVKDIESRTFDTIIRFPRDKREPYEAQLIDTVPYLNAWLEFHPYRNRPDAPLFVATNGESWVEDSARKSFNRLVRRAGIKRRITFHYFRHTAAFRLKMQGRSREEANILLNWSARSNMFEHYGKLTPQDVWEKTLVARGFVAKKEGELLVCPRCNAKNAFERDFCLICHHALNQEATKKVNDVIVQYSEDMRQMAERLLHLEERMDKRKASG